MGMNRTTASDGFPAYTLPNCTREKLHVIKDYFGITCTAMKDKFALAYADLLAGPGLCVDTYTREEQPGSALLAVERPEFKRLFINDRDPGITKALRYRTLGQPSDRLRISTGDCNEVIDEARKFLFPWGLSGSLGIAVIDPSGLQMRFDSIDRLTDGVKMDLIIVVMSSFIRRFLTEESFESPLRGVYGTWAWQELADARKRGETVTNELILGLYKRQLKTIGYPFVNDLVRTENSRRRTMYHIIFASRNERGQEFYEKISGKQWNGQKRMPLFLPDTPSPMSLQTGELFDA